MTVSNWLAEIRESQYIKVTSLPWSENQEWSFEKGVLRHKTGGFFSVCGIELSARGYRLDGKQFPMIDQPEVGLLAFLVCRSESGYSWLLQAKTEPGTTEYTQIGPSIQATKSNYLQLHGGAETAYLSKVIGNNRKLLTNVNQSEQGSRFINKYNNNVVRLLGEPVQAVSHNWKWFNAADLRKALAKDFLINTDARSVIVSTCWTLLSDTGQPFTEKRPIDETVGSLEPVECHNFRERLGYSFKSGKQDASNAIQRLQDTSLKKRITIRKQPLDTLSGWQLTDDGIISSDPAFEFDVRSYYIKAQGRECENWQQPLLRSNAAQRSILFIKDDGCLKIFFRFSQEPGFVNSVQFGPSWQSDGHNPEWLNEHIPDSASSLLLAIDQSDEGGRFMESIMRYEIRELSETTELEDGGMWLTMAQVNALSTKAGILTNEARSAVSLLLAFV